MRKKWEIEDEYRKFCRNNKELALQTLRELTLTPTETGKEEQRIAYCVEWMKRQGMESVHTDELGNVIWEYRPEQKKKVLYTAHLDTVFSLEEPLEIKEDGMIWRCPGITDDTVNVVMLLMAAKYVHETEPELPCGLLHRIWEKKGLAISAASAHLSTIMKKICAEWQPLICIGIKCIPSASDLSDIGFRQKQRAVIPF